MAICRICKKEIDKTASDWIMPSRNYYYHKTCYDTWRNLKNRSDEDWTTMIYDFLARDIKVSYNWHQIESQRKNLIKEHGFTNKGIYFTLYWYFYNKRQTWKEEYGIGIVPYIYEEAKYYWEEQERKTKGIMKQIEDLVIQRGQQQVPLNEQKSRRNKKIKAPE